MRLAIRDDDTNFFTTAEQLEACYKDIWGTITPSLCLISKVKGKWDHWVHQIYKDKQNTDWNAWENDDTIYPIEENIALVDFLKIKIKERKLDIGFHAKYHRNEDDTLPNEVKQNYIRGAEFYTNRDLTKIIQEEVNHLNDLLNTNISVFTPPQNLLSTTGYQSVLNAQLNICGGGITFYKKQKDLSGLVNIGKQLLFKLNNKGCDYPYVLEFSDHTEIPYHYPLQPNTQLETLIQQFEMVKRFDGDFVLSTHYVEFDYPMVYDSSKTMKNVLYDFLDYTSKFNIQYTSLSKLLEKNR